MLSRGGIGDFGAANGRTVNDPELALIGVCGVDWPVLKINDADFPVAFTHLIGVVIGEQKRIIETAETTEAAPKTTTPIVRIVRIWIDAHAGISVVDPDHSHAQIGGFPRADPLKPPARQSIGHTGNKLTLNRSQRWTVAVVRLDNDRVGQTERLILSEIDAPVPVGDLYGLVVGSEIADGVVAAGGKSPANGQQQGCIR